MGRLPAGRMGRLTAGQMGRLTAGQMGRGRGSKRDQNGQKHDRWSSYVTHRRQPQSHLCPYFDQWYFDQWSKYDRMGLVN